MRAVLFDLDGTLIDHFSAIQRACAYAGRKLSLREPGYEEVRRTVGGSVPKTLTKLFGAEHVEAALPLFHEHFKEIMLDDVEALPGSDWILEQLHGVDGFRLAVFTNKDEAPAKAVLAHLGLDRWLDEIVGTSNVSFRKPQPEFTTYALQRVGCEREDAIMVGDSPFDFAAAQTGPMPCYLVATGSHSREQLDNETGADRVFADLYELGETVFDLERPVVLNP